MEEFLEAERRWKQESEREIVKQAYGELLPHEWPLTSERKSYLAFEVLTASKKCKHSLETMRHQPLLCLHRSILESISAFLWSPSTTPPKNWKAACEAIYDEAIGDKNHLQDSLLEFARHTYDNTERFPVLSDEAGEY